jgi:hypothetical protein
MRKIPSSTPHPTSHPTPRQIVGLSLAPATAKAFKAEAASRGLSVRNLFEEMWETYKATAKKARP